MPEQFDPKERAREAAEAKEAQDAGQMAKLGNRIGKNQIAISEMKTTTGDVEFGLNATSPEAKAAEEERLAAQQEAVDERSKLQRLLDAIGYSRS